MELLSEHTGGEKSPHIVSAFTMLAVSIVLASVIGSYSFYRVHTLGNTLSVTGSATQKVEADTAQWTIAVNRTALESGIPSAQTKVASDAQQVIAFFEKAGVDEKDITTSTVYVDEIYSSDANAPRSYTVHEDIAMSSDDPTKVESLSKNVGDLLAKGVLVSAQEPQYFVSNLPQLRVALIGKAVDDAKARATEIAKATGQKVGDLESASGGVVQVLAPNSVDVADDGSYDTSTIEKQVMVTAHATFYIH